MRHVLELSPDLRGRDNGCGSKSSWILCILWQIFLKNSSYFSNQLIAQSLIHGICSANSF